VRTVSNPFRVAGGNSAISVSIRRTTNMENDLIVEIRKNRIDHGLLVLRLGAGISLLGAFGLTKLREAVMFTLAGHSWPFVDANRNMGLPAPVIVAWYQTLNESLGALLVTVGFLSRVAAASLGLGFLAATYLSLKAGEDGASMIAASCYCLMFSTLALTGPGRFSIDDLLGQRSARKKRHGVGAHR
jgi:uncharacterized membrane protein YphA (DoxX/SURF4 family)